MGTHIIWPTEQYQPMKTTIEISDPLLLEARKVAQREGVTLRALVERGLDRVIRETKRPISFKLRRATFNGKGLREEFRSSPWEAIRHEIYRGRGG
jgi:hypothetical protein